MSDTTCPAYPGSAARDCLDQTRPGTRHVACWQARRDDAALDRVIERRLGPTCNYEVCDGNADDPSYAYCGHPSAHAGDHGEWKV